LIETKKKYKSKFAYNTHPGLKFDITTWTRIWHHN